MTYGSLGISLGARSFFLMHAAIYGFPKLRSCVRERREVRRESKERGDGGEGSGGEGRGERRCREGIEGAERRERGERMRGEGHHYTELACCEDFHLNRRKLYSNIIVRVIVYA